MMSTLIEDNTFLTSDWGTVKFSPDAPVALICNIKVSRLIFDDNVTVFVILFLCYLAQGIHLHNRIFDLNFFLLFFVMGL